MTAPNRPALWLFVAVLSVASAGAVEARIDPLRTLTDRFVRPEIVFVIEESRAGYVRSAVRALVNSLSDLASFALVVPTPSGAASGPGRLRVALLEATRTTPSARFDAQRKELLARLALPTKGAAWTALQTARAHIAEREETDEAAGCRPRFVFVLSGSGCAEAGAAEAKLLFRKYGTVTVVAALPGLAATSDRALAELDALADCGDDGDCENSSAKALRSGSPRRLAEQLRAIVSSAIRGRYATAAAGISSRGAPGSGNVVLVTSTTFPGWRGELEARDLGQSFRSRLWAAGQRLARRDWRSRVIFTGTHLRAAGVPFRVFTAAGTVATAALAALWPAPSGPPAASEIQAMIEWLAGKGRDWRLPPIIRAVPATVGPPPSYAVGDHAAFARRQRRRQRLIYVSSNEGLLHAFESQRGDEVFAFLPPHLLPKIYALYKAGGQRADPGRFVYISAASPSVDDIRTKTGWKTVLVQGDGPGGEDFVALDITAMPRCDERSPRFASKSRPGPPVCTGSPAPRVLFSSAYASPSLTARLGETWSVPTIFWGSSLAPRVALGSGYGAAGKWYNLFDAFDPWQSPRTGGARGAHVVLADTVTVRDPVTRAVVATYQADLGGRLWAYEGGEPTKRRAIIDLGPRQPIYYSPAALLVTDQGPLLLALSSGAHAEAGIRVVRQGRSLERGGVAFRPRLYVYTDTRKAPHATLVWGCAIDRICSGCGLTMAARSACVQPSGRAQPIGSPMLALNEAKGRRIEAFFAVYDPPRGICSLPGAVCTTGEDCPFGQRCRAGACRGVAVGDSYLFHIAIDPNAKQQRLLQAVKYSETLATGLMSVRGGSEIVLSTEAGVLPLGGTARRGARVAIESWRELRSN